MRGCRGKVTHETQSSFEVQKKYYRKALDLIARDLSKYLVYTR